MTQANFAPHTVLHASDLDAAINSKTDLDPNTGKLVLSEVPQSLLDASSQAAAAKTEADTNAAAITTLQGEVSSYTSAITSAASTAAAAKTEADSNASAITSIQTTANAAKTEADANASAIAALQAAPGLTVTDGTTSLTGVTSLTLHNGVVSGSGHNAIFTPSGGGGSGVQNAMSISRPPAPHFSWIHQTAGTVMSYAQDGSGNDAVTGPLSIIANPQTSNGGFEAFGERLTRTNNWTLTLSFADSMAASNYFSSGIVLYDSTTGKWVVFQRGVNSVMSLYVWYMSSYKQYNSAPPYAGESFAKSNYPIQFTAQDDGTNLNFGLSIDGVAPYTKFISAPRGAYCNVDTVGFGINVNDYNGVPGNCVGSLYNYSLTYQ